MISLNTNNLGIQRYDFSATVNGIFSTLLVLSESADGVCLFSRHETRDFNYTGSSRGSGNRSIIRDCIHRVRSTRVGNSRYRDHRRHHHCRSLATSSIER